MRTDQVNRTPVWGSWRELVCRLVPALVMSLVLWVALIAGASVAFAGGSDSPTPYTVDRAGGAQ